MSSTRSKPSQRTMYFRRLSPHGGNDSTGRLLCPLGTHLLCQVLRLQSLWTLCRLQMPITNPRLPHHAPMASKCDLMIRGREKNCNSRSTTKTMFHQCYATSTPPATLCHRSGAMLPLSTVTTLRCPVDAIDQSLYTLMVERWKVLKGVWILTCTSIGGVVRP